MAPAESSPAAPAAAPNAWEERIKAFSEAVSKPADDIVTALKPLVGEPGPAALAALSDPTAVTDTDLQEALSKGGPAIPLGILRKNLSKLRGPQIAGEPATAERAHSFDALPSVPEDASFLEMLKVGGSLKVGKVEVISAMKAAIAEQLGLFDIPTTLTEKMESFAEAQEEPVGPDFYTLRKLIARRSYAEVLAVLDVPGDFVTAGRRSAFLEKLNTLLWPELASFHRQLVGWSDSWNTGAANPGLALTMMAMAQSGNRMAMPPGMLQPPDTSAVRDSAEALINTINKVFAGFGIPVARALAYDATKIKEVLENNKLPPAIGATNKDQMLKMLGIAVGADYVRTERNITRYTLAAMELKDVPGGNEEYAYLGALLQLGLTIQWDKLPGGVATRAGIGRGTRNGIHERAL
ncbi:MAG TPA: hypothetical protein VFT82_03035 [Candidatus Paceibacterota bacterium]|nr:hypothetical protein [Candidatus Paceibacterota bacterium]